MELNLKDRAPFLRQHFKLLKKLSFDYVIFTNVKKGMGVDIIDFKGEKQSKDLFTTLGIPYCCMSQYICALKIFMRTRKANESEDELAVRWLSLSVNEFSQYLLEGVELKFRL